MQPVFRVSPLFLQMLVLWFPKDMQNWLSSKNITLDHAAAVQCFWSLEPGRDISDAVAVSRGAWHKKCHRRNPSLAYVCALVVLQALTPAAVHSLWISVSCFNRFSFTIFTRLRLFLFHYYLTDLFLPFASLFTCLDTELCEQTTSPAMTFSVLPSLCEVSFGRLSSQQYSPCLYRLQNYTERPLWRFWDN